MTAPHHPRRGFSLIELVVVMLLLATIAALASVPLRGAVERRELAAAVDVVRRFDNRLRRDAIYRRVPTWGRIEPDRQRLVIESERRRGSVFGLPRRVVIDRIRFAGGGSTAAARRLAVSARGVSTSYAIRLTAGSIRRWVFVAGGSGQVVSVAEELPRGGSADAALDTLLSLR